MLEYNIPPFPFAKLTLHISDTLTEDFRVPNIYLHS